MSMKLFLVLAMVSIALLAYIRPTGRTLALAAIGIFAGLFAMSAGAAPEPWQLQETRYCGTPQRAPDGSILRSVAVLRAFQRIHPCPETGKTTGACPGWALNHVIPLACGGCDSVANLDWMPDEIKSCREPWCRDRFERKIYDATDDIAGTAACKNSIVTWPKSE